MFIITVSSELSIVLVSLLYGVKMSAARIASYLGCKVRIHIIICGITSVAHASFTL